MTSKTYRTMAAKTMVAATAAIAALCWTPQEPQAAVDLYDDFSSPLIDRTKWSSLEFVRQIDNGVLKLELTRFGSNGNNSLRFADPDAVSSFQADVTVTAVSITSATARARLQGRFYNDGSPGGGLNGEIFADIDIRDSGAGLHVGYFVSRCDNSDCTSDTVLISDNTTFGSVILGETHTLSLAWDGTQFFTFGFDGDTVQFDPTLVAPVVGPPKFPQKKIGTRVKKIDGPAEGGAISATFDNVRVNGAPYDDFSSALIDRTKWRNLEFVRRIDNGVLKSELTRFGSSGNNSLPFADPAMVSSFQADVTVTAVSNTAANARARLNGRFYNDGSPGGGLNGEISANIDIRDHGTGLHVAYNVRRCTNSDCTSSTDLIFAEPFGSVNLGETHTLSLAWDGRRFFTFGFDGNTAQFDSAAVAPVAGPSKVPRKRIGTRVSGIAGPNEGAHIKATFDNVKLISLAKAMPWLYLLLLND